MMMMTSGPSVLLQMETLAASGATAGAGVAGKTGEVEESAVHFERATPIVRAFLCWQQFFAAKRFCILTLLLTFLLVLQFIPFILPTDRQDDSTQKLQNLTEHLVQRFFFLPASATPRPTANATRSTASPVASGPDDGSGLQQSAQ